MCCDINCRLRYSAGTGNDALLGLKPCSLLPFIQFKSGLMQLFTHNVKRWKTPLNKNGDFGRKCGQGFTLKLCSFFFEHKKLFFNRDTTNSLDSRDNGRLLLLLLLLTLNSGRLVAIQVLRTGKWGTLWKHASSGKWRRHKTALKTH